MHTTGEVTDVAKGYEKAADFVNGTKVQTEVGLHFTSLSWTMHASQSVVRDWKYAPTLQEKWYRPMTRLGLRPDVIDAAQALERYRLIFSPMVMTLEEHDLGSRMAQWVRDGGTWVVGPLSDVRNMQGARYQDRFYGLLEELTGVAWCYGCLLYTSRCV